MDDPIDVAREVNFMRRRRIIPQRIQRRRDRGWRAPESATYVGRPSRWGNPWRVGFRMTPTSQVAADRFATGLRLRRLDPTTVSFTDDEYYALVGIDLYPSDDEIRSALAGRDLMCWCRIDAPCHADTLLEIANEPS